MHRKPTISRSSLNTKCQPHLWGRVQHRKQQNLSHLFCSEEKSCTPGKKYKKLIFGGTKSYDLSKVCHLPKFWYFLESRSFGITLIVMYFIITVIGRELRIQKSCLCVKPVKFRSAQSLGERGTEYRCNNVTMLKQIKLVQTL